MRRRMGRPGLMGTMARTAVVAGTATAVSGGMRQHAAQKQAAQQAAEQPPAPAPQDTPAEPAAQVPQDTPAEPAAQAPAAPAPGMSSTDKVAAIKGLGELKDQGLLTEQEFAAEKAKVLAG